MFVVTLVCAVATIGLTGVLLLGDKHSDKEWWGPVALGSVAAIIGLWLTANSSRRSPRM